MPERPSGFFSRGGLRLGVLYLADLMIEFCCFWTKFRKRRTMRCSLNEGRVAELLFAEREVLGCWKAQMFGLLKVIWLTSFCVTAHRIPMRGL
jgi:hypothetical protein